MMRGNRHNQRSRGAVRWTAIIVGAVVVVAGAVAVPALLGGDEEPAARPKSGKDTKSAPEWETVTKRTFDVVVTAKGQVEAGKKGEIRNLVKGKTTITEILPEGTKVQEGEVVVRLADDELIKDLDEERLDTAAARANVTTAEKELQILTIKAETDRQAAEVKRDLAKLELAKWEKGVLKQKKEELSVALDKAERNLKIATKDLENSKKLLDEKFISEKEYETDWIAELEARAALSAAKLNIEVHTNYEMPAEKRQFESDVTQAEAELKTTIAESEQGLEQARADLKAKQLQLEIREEKLADLTAQLAATKLCAPTDGVVVYGSTVSTGYWRDDDQIAQGSTVYFNQTLVILPDLSQMTTSLLVHESLIASVNVDDPATIMVDALQGKPVTGKVIRIDQAAEDGGRWNRDLRQYRVHVLLDDSPALARLKPAMRAVGRIVTDRVEDKIAIPIQAVHSVKRSKFCYVPGANGRIEKREVEIGRANETLVEITSGLSAGDRVLLRSPLPGEVAGS